MLRLRATTFFSASVPCFEAAGDGPGTASVWLQSCSWPRQAARGGNCHRSSGRPGQRSTGGSPAGARPGSGHVCTASSSMNSEPRASWTGCASPSILSASEHSKGAADRTESDRPRQEWIDNPPRRGPQRPSRRRRHLSCQHTRQPRAAAADRIHPAGAQPSRAPATAACELTETRATTTLTCGDGSESEASHHASLAAAPTPHSDWADTAGWSNGPYRGSPTAADCRRLPPPAPPLRTQA